MIDYNRWGGRRFLLCVATQISLTVLKWAGKVGDEVFGMVILGTVGVFVAGNVVQRKIEKDSQPADHQ